MSDISTEQVVDSRYRIIRKLGSGGMSDVYLCDDVNLGRKIALKILHSRYAQDREFVERFQREARAAASLQHHNVVSIYDRGQFADTYYIAMEYLEGRSLKELITKEAPLKVDRALNLARQILAALSYSHQNGIIHRDVKPQNVIVDDDDRAKVMDFGIARAAGSEITEVGSILGTAQYLSPEQAQGRPVSDASDIYSVGVVLYEMLTGCVPFDGESAVSVALKHVNEDPQPIGQLVNSVPDQVKVVVMRALAKDPSRRYQSAQAFAVALDGLGESNEVSGQDTASWKPVVAPEQKSQAKAAKTGKRKKQKSVKKPKEDESKPDGYKKREKKAEKEKWLTRKRLLWAGLIAVVLAGLAAGGFFIFKTEKVEVPTLIGAEVEDARSTIERSELVVEVRRVQSDAPVGQVLEQDPLSGERVEKQSVVKLTVSKGPGTTKVPNLAGLSEKTAKSRLKKADLKAEIERENSVDIELGRVIRSDPRSSEVVTMGSRVLIVISSGPAEVDVPSVTGMSQEEAQTVLKEADLNVIIEREDSSKDEGTVIEQTPAAGSRVDEGTSVTIVVSNGKGAEVPGVIGSSEGSAVTQLEKAGFEVSVKEKNVDKVEDDGIVLSQSPSKGAKKKKGDIVTITVGLFELPEPESTG